MTSVQERLQIKRTALDKWSIRERLCLASAVHCSGDQNWMSVSRTLKLLCASHNRPPDWFSQKSCAVQYGELLENVETPKRKKRTNSDNQNQPAETPTESILRNLKQERMSELEILIQKEKDIYKKLHKDAITLQSSTATDEQIRELWKQTQQEKEQIVLEEQKYNDWLKEREQKKLELQRAWRPPFATTLNPTNLTGSLQASQGTNLKHEDMDIDETITPTASSITPMNKPQQTATSPLLTSLLKTPSPTVGSTNVVQTSSITSARVQAPTITNLLTGGQLPPNVTCHQQYKIVHPLTGPPIHMTGSPQIIQSPSQAAPTLSMLLESKATTKETLQTNVEIEEKTDNTQIEQEGDGSDSTNKDELMEVFKGLIDENENIDELADILTNNNAIIPAILDEALENVDLEEQLNQENALLDEINETNIEDNNSKITKEINDTDETLNMKFKKDCDNSELIKKEEIVEDASEKSTANLSSIVKEIKEESNNTIQFVEAKEEPQEVLNEIKEKPKMEEFSLKQSIIEIERDDKKSEISEDSGDMTFQEIANEIKEKIKAEECQDSKESSDDMEIADNLQSIQSIESDDKKSVFTFEDSQDVAINKTENSEKLDVSLVKENSRKSTSESSDVIIIPEDDESNEKNKNKDNISLNNNMTNVETKVVIKEKVEIDEKSNDIKIVLKTELDSSKKEESATITIIDTDDDSVHTDIMPKEEKLNECSVTRASLKRDSTYLKSEIEEKKEDEKEDSKNLITKRVLRGTEQEDSESTAIDDDTNDLQMPRTRRRFSSTPNIDSTPNSPASSIEIIDQKAWKKSILTAYNKLISYKFSSLLLRVPTDDQVPKYKSIILHPIDLTTLKKSIDNGVIKSTLEFQRDLMLICANALMFYERDTEHFTAAKEFLAEVKTICSKLLEKEGKKDDDIQDTSISAVNTPLSNTSNATSLGSSKRSRKSQRF